jgi:pantoate--beta-alanine ligase
MIIFKKIPALAERLNELRSSGSLGYVPTMGALHEGHLELVRTSRRENKYTIVSIFVNPAQFNDPKDFQKYPITLEKDIELLIREETDIVFLPDQLEIYPQGFSQKEYYDLGILDQILEGKFRPGHFQGVCKVVSRLLEIVDPNRLYLGQKDYQQCMVIAKLIEMMGKETTMRICETVREPDGLAMSSRNMRLTPEERTRAPLIHTMLEYCRTHLQVGNLDALKDNVCGELTKNGFRIDYFEFAHTDSLEIRKEWNGIEPLVALAAVFLREVRLIDNLKVSL